MKPRRATLGLEFYLGTIQYCVALFGGGAVWFVTAHLTNFFSDDPTIKIAASLLLVALILAERYWQAQDVSDRSESNTL